MRGIRLRPFAAAALVLSLVGSPSLPAQQLEEAAQEIANQISLSLIEEGRKNIAVLPLTDLSNETTIVGEALAEELFNRLFRLRQGKFEIVERSKIRAIWDEQTDFSDQWLLDNMEGFSRLLGADAVLVGTHFELDGYHRVNARLLAVPSGKFLATASTRLAGVVGLGRESLLVERAETEVPAPRRNEPIATWTSNEAKVDLLPCTLRGDRLECDILVTATEDQRACIYPSSRVIERDGLQVDVSSIRFSGPASDNAVCADLVREVPIRGSLVFAGVKSSLAAGGVSLIEVDFYSWRAQFRDILPTSQVD